MLLNPSRRQCSRSQYPWLRNSFSRPRVQWLVGALLGCCAVSCGLWRIYHIKLLRSRNKLETTSQIEKSRSQIMRVALFTISITTHHMHMMESENETIESPRLIIPNSCPNEMRFSWKFIQIKIFSVVIPVDCDDGDNSLLLFLYS